VFAWSGNAKIVLLNYFQFPSFFVVEDPKFEGFKPIEEDRFLSRVTILSGSKEFFKEADSISYKHISDFLSERIVFYVEKKEFNDNIRKGTVFFFVTCLLDWIICVM
jgi:hypothetical protein